MKRCIFIVLLCGTILLSACGGSTNNGTTSGPSQLTSAVIKIVAQGTPSTSPIGAIQVKLNLPVGVTMKTTQNAPQTDTGVVTASGNASGAELSYGVYSSGTATVYVVKSAGFTIGEFATVKCDIAAGSVPKAADFGVSNLSVWDTTSGAPVTGLTASFSATIN